MSPASRKLPSTDRESTLGLVWLRWPGTSSGWQPSGWGWRPADEAIEQAARHRRWRRREGKRVPHYAIETKTVVRHPAVELHDADLDAGEARLTDQPIE